jgi:hypothetical protein
MKIFGAFMINTAVVKSTVNAKKDAPQTGLGKIILRF